MLTNNHFFMILGLSRLIVHFTTRNHSSAFITCSLWTYKSNDVHFLLPPLPSIHRPKLYSNPSVHCLSFPPHLLQAEKARRDLLTSALSFESAKTSSFVFPTTIYADTLASKDFKTIEYLMASTTHNDIYPTIISIDSVNSVIRLVCNINGCRFTVDPTLPIPQCRKNKNSAPTKGHEQRGKNQLSTFSFFTVADKFQTVDQHPLASKNRVNTTVSFSTEVRVLPYDTHSLSSFPIMFITSIPINMHLQFAAARHLPCRENHFPSIRFSTRCLEWTLKHMS